MNDDADQREKGRFDVSRFDCFRGFQRPVLMFLDQRFLPHYSAFTPEFTARKPSFYVTLETLRQAFQLHITAGESGFTAGVADLTKVRKLHQHLPLQLHNNSFLLQKQSDIINPRLLQ